MEMILFTTRACNLRCAYCYVNKTNGRNMTDETANASVDFLFNNSKDGFHTLSFFGGEPLVNFPLIVRCVERAEAVARERNKRIRYKIATNGTLINDEIIAFLKKHKFMVELSIDGIPECHDAARPHANGEGSFAAIQKMLPELKANVPFVVGVGVINPHTAKYAASAPQFVIEKLGITTYVLTLDYTCDWTSEDFAALKEQYERIAEWYLDASRRRKAFFFSLFDSHIGAHIRGGFYPGGFCDVGRKEIAVAEDGTIYPCVRFAGNPEKAASLTIGHVATGFDEKRRAEITKMNLKPRKECSGCALDGRCFTYCSCLNWQTTGRFDRVSPKLCENERMLMPIVDGVAKTLYEELNPSFMKKHYAREIADGQFPDF